MTIENPFLGGQSLLKEHKDYIDKVCRQVAYSFWKVEEEDLQQEVSLFLWQKEADFLEQQRSPAYVAKCIYHVAINYAYKERSKTLVESDLFYYNADEVKLLLPAFFGTSDAWANAAVPPGAETMTKNDNVEIMCDFSIAFDKLNPTQRDVLRRKYADDDDFSTSKDRQALSRAHRRFVMVLNNNKDAQARAHQGPGSRKVITNAAGISKKNGDIE